MIYTFYSYKGGVGRSMALANLAELLCQTGLDVLMIDWDLEAPGLERFFSIPADALERPGLIDMILDYKAQTLERAHAAAQEDENSINFSSPTNYVLEVYPRREAQGRLLLLTAGRRARGSFVDYARTVLDFDWRDFYERWQGELYFEWLRDELSKLADVVLIDSRTGVTEMGGVCTYQLADLVVMFCTASDQCIQGTYQMAQNLSAPEVHTLRRGRQLEMLILPARLERAEGDLLDQFQALYAEIFQRFLPAQLNARELFLQAGIPYVPKYAFSETVATRESGRASAEAMVVAFRKIEDILSELRLERLALTHPAEAARQIGMMFRAVSLEDSDQLLKLVTLTERHADYLSDIVEILVYARGIETFLRGDRIGAASQFSKLPLLGETVQVLGLNLFVPAKVLEVIRQKVWSLRDFDLVIEGTDGKYQVRAAGQVGEVALPTKLPVTIEDVIENTSVVNVDPRSFAAYSTAPVNWGRQVGQALFELAFSGPVLTAFRENLARIVDDERLRVRLSVPDDLASLPWELLYDPEHAKFLGVLDEIVLVRSQPASKVNAPVQVDTSIHIRVLTAPQRDASAAPLKTDQYMQQLDQLLRSPIERGELKLSYNPVTMASGQSLWMTSGQPIHILHLHCKLLLSEAGTQHILLVDNPDNRAEHMTLENLRIMLDAQMSLSRLFSLDIYTEEVSEVDITLLESISRAFRGASYSVLILPSALKNDTRAEFIRIFYSELAVGTPLDLAFVEGRRYLESRFAGSLDWARPVLFLQSRDGVIFDLKRYTGERQAQKSPLKSEPHMSYYAELIALSPEVIPTVLQLNAEYFTIGRSKACDMVVSMSLVSRLHARVVQSGPRHLLEDSGSANGVYVNGRRLVGPHPLASDDLIGLGSPHPLLRYVDSDATHPPYQKLRFDERHMLFFVGQQALDLSPIEFRLLEHLYKYAGDICTRASCAKAIWGNDYDPSLDASALDQAMSNLRRTLRNADPSAEYLETRRGLGYRLVL